MIKVITGNEAAAYGAMLAQPAVITAYPITPASRIPEQLSEFYAEGKLRGKFINVESSVSNKISSLTEKTVRFEKEFEID